MNARPSTRWLHWIAASQVRRTVFLSGCLALMLGFAYVVHLRGHVLEIDRQIGHSQRLRSEQADKTVQVQALAAGEAQLAALQHKLDESRWRLAAGAELADVLEGIALQGQADEVFVEQVALLPEIAHEHHIELPMQLQARGTYTGLVSFVHGLAQLPRLLTVQGFSLLPVPEQQPTGLRLQVQISAHRSRVASVGAFSSRQSLGVARPLADLSRNPFELSPQVQQRQYLETLPLEQFEMIGSLARGRVRFALLRAEGLVHRLQVGDRLGRDSGRVVSIEEQQIEIAEEVFVAGKGLVERRRTMSLKSPAGAG